MKLLTTLTALILYAYGTFAQRYGIEVPNHGYYPVKKMPDGKQWLTDMHGCIILELEQNL